MTPSQSGWTENVLYDFQGQNDGAQPIGSLMFDQYGNLYGATAGHGTGGGGTVGWAFNMLYSFAGREFEGPYAGLVMDVAGNLYGTPYGDDQYGCYGVGCGSVFRLHQSGGWTFTSLHDFTGGSDGANPISSVVVDANGNLYGTASWGGTGSACFRGCGVVWEITP